MRKDQDFFQYHLRKMFGTSPYGSVQQLQFMKNLFAIVSRFQNQNQAMQPVSNDYVKLRLTTLTINAKLSE